MRIRRPLLLLALLVAVLAVAAPAAAHTQIQRAVPGPGESVDGEVDSVVLDFLDPVVPTPEITVTGPDGELVDGLAPAELIADDVAVARFDPLTVGGEYRVDYTFVALDGDEQVSAHTFTFEPDSGLDLAVRPLLAWLVGGVLLVLLVAAVLGRRRSGRGAEPAGEATQKHSALRRRSRQPDRAGS
ncbi:copper resistance protein CopC [Acidimicrobiia bacterium EGI L10123]|uniref:copper resistance protein CopC n=1 Tax=Salinilacustrithrix flava TaxID=2957203 RepID=UPI003D7C230F|nr:copper resistance protein CopC [Acidimicrobiia bacterium EGI L10123]